MSPRPRRRVILHIYGVTRAKERPIRTRPLPHPVRTDAPPAAPRRAAVRPLPNNARPPAPRLPLLGDWLALALAVALFVASASYGWRLPGFYNDEAYDVIPAMQLVLGQPVEPNRGVGLHLFGRDFPLMISDYQGISSMYVVLPLFALFGPGVGPTRAMTIGFGIIAIVLSYFLGRRLFGRPAGLVAALLLATAPSYIFWSRVGVYVVCQIVPLALGACLVHLRWRDSRRVGWLALAGLLAGIGLSTKILFIWFLLGVFGAGIAVWLLDWRWPLDRQGRTGRRRPLGAALAARPALRPAEVGGALTGFLIGAAPLIAYNIASGGTLKILRANTGQTEKGVDNSDFLRNFLGRFGAFKTVLEGSYFWFLGETHANLLVLPGFLLCAVGLVAFVCLVPGYRRFRNTVAFILVLILAILVQSSFTLSGLEATHLLLLLPFPLLLCGAFVEFAGQELVARYGRRLRRPAPRGLLAALPGLLLLAPLVAGNLLIGAHYHEALARSGGKSSFSDRIYELATLLDSPKGANDPFDYRRPYALDWGMKYNVELLTDGRVQPQEIFGQGPNPPPDFLQTLDTLFADPDAIYIAHRIDGVNPPAAYPDRARLFLQHVEERGKRIVTVKTIAEPGGAPLFYIYTVRDR
jgi:hypothetical protein